MAFWFAIFLNIFCILCFNQTSAFYEYYYQDSAEYQDYLYEYDSVPDARSFECSTVDYENEVFSRTGILDEDRLWKTVRAVYSSKFNVQAKNNIKAAYSQLKLLLPCVNFEPIFEETGKEDEDQDIVYINKANACGVNYIGRNGGLQKMGLTNDCASTVEGILHEWLHILGLFHEHSAPDRDVYITVLWENIKNPKFFVKRQRSDTATFSIPYNPRSILHFKPNEYSKNENPTYELTPEGVFNYFRYSQSYPGYNQLQVTDVQKLRSLYNCTGRFMY